MYKEIITDVESIKLTMISHVTEEAQSNSDYQHLRQKLINNEILKEILPEIVFSCQNLSKVKSKMQEKSPRWEPRRQYIRDEFERTLSLLKSTVDAAPIKLAEKICKFGSVAITDEWKKAIYRKNTDPAGSITIAKTLLESVCKHILEKTGKNYGKKEDLPALYKKCADCLNLSPKLYEEEEFKKILSGCFSIIHGLSNFRNKVGDAHGKGSIFARPLPRHAEFAVNLSGSLSLFLITTWEEKVSSKSSNHAT